MSTMEQRERYEALYHATTQYLLLRDFQNAEDAVLTLLNFRPRDVDAYGLEQKLVRCTEPFEERLKRWTRSSEDMIKAYKLYAFVLTSKHTERLEVSGPESGAGAGKENLADVFEGVIATYKKESDFLDRPAATAKSESGSQVIHLHPSILQTILLSLLKLNSTYPIPYSESLSSSQRSDHPLHIARTFVERWLAGLEEETIKTLSFPKKFIGRCKSRTSTDIQSRSSPSEAPSASSSSSSSNDNGNENENDNENDDWVWYAISERLGGMNKAYRSVLRTYVLDILPRFGDWELSREMILAGLFPKAEEQEKLLKKLHTLEIQHKQLQDLSRSATISGPNSSSLSSSMSSSGFGPGDEPGASDLDRGAGPSMSMSTSRSNTTIRPGSGTGFTRTPGVERPASPSAASVLTDRTVRAVDYMKGRQRQGGGEEISASGFGQQETRRDDRRSPRAQVGEDKKETDQERKGSEEKSAGSKRGDEDSVVGSTRSLTQGSARFGHAAFETLRARIVRYLDTPIDQDHDHDGHHGNDGDSRPRARRSLSVSSRRTKDLAGLPLHQRLSRNFTFRLIVRLLSAISIVAFVWGLIRRRRQVRRRRAIAQGGTVGDPIIEGSFVQEVQDAVKVVRDKIVAVFKMGTTISYV